jgi:hypothetical protein
MTKDERDRFAKAIWEKIDDDALLYDELPADGKDDYILSLIRVDIEKVKKEWPVTG